MPTILSYGVEFRNKVLYPYFTLFLNCFKSCKHQIKNNLVVGGEKKI